MKVAILTEGGSRIGFGHLSRCLSLYQAFKKRRITPRFIVNGDESAREFLKNEECTLLNWLKEKDKLYKIISDVDVGIVDSYLAGIAFYKDISRRIKIPVYLDDTKRLNYPKGVVINGSIYAREIAYLKEEGISYLLGIKYALLRKEFWKVPKKVINRDIERIMVTFGGDDSRNMSPKILGFINKEYPAYIKNVVVGSGFKNVEEIKKSKDAKTNIVFHPNAKTMKKLMLESDVAISAGGISINELAKVGVPTIAIVVADNQLNNIKTWQQVGFVEDAGFWNNKAVLSSVRDKLILLRGKSIRKKKSMSGRQKVDGRGPKLVCDLIINRFDKTRGGTGA